ncbi:hypothetical protein [Bacillus sp. (in: firmicutes)]|uniref:hypothetical protein n=1 Tax=Bacillus sp. TaxID=1409 RepID=UPI0023F2D8C6|nr:hypothetical protein [Bacillus sp. (in: firmicutes)]
MSFIPEVNEKEVGNTVISRSLKAKIGERKKKRDIGLFSQLRKSTEYNELKVKQMDRAQSTALIKMNTAS